MSPFTSCVSSSTLFKLYLLLNFFSHISTSHPDLPNPRERIQDQNSSQNHIKCNETCGTLQVPFPFYITNSSCGLSSNTSSSSIDTTFQLSCMNSTSLYLNLNSQNYRVIQFFADGILVDFPGFSNTCRPYNDLKSFEFSTNNYFGISNDNVIGLYDCEDSSLCKADCEACVLPSCDGSSENSPTCCYPLNDHSIWHVGDGFEIFTRYECRGFSCWTVVEGVSSGRRGVKLEWAVPRNVTEVGICDGNGRSVNASSIKHGVRCVCDDGFVGDGFANGTGCLKYCIKDGKDAYGKDCETNDHRRRKMIILAGVLVSVFAALVSLLVLCLLRRSTKSSALSTLKPRKPHFNTTLSFRKTCNTRLFTIKELEEATSGFSDDQKVVEITTGSMYSGFLEDGTHVAVQKVHCENERDLMQVLSRVEILSTILHRHIARLLGCCIDSGYTPMLVYEYTDNGTLEEHLHIPQSKEPVVRLDWYKRLSITAQTAKVLAYLQHDMSPPIFHHDLKPGCIFLDQEFSVKLAGFGLLNSSNANLVVGVPHSISSNVGSNFYRSDVYDLGVLLLEVISGSKHLDLPTVALQKIRDGKLEEIVDPLLYYYEQPVYRREQIERVADIATRCLLFGGDGKLSMTDVARELVHITRESIDFGASRRGPAIEETFSNSSLLQMISMSPDSIYVP